MHYLKRGHGGDGTEIRKGLSPLRPWTVLVVVGVIGVAAHSAALYYVLSHRRVSVAVVSGVVILIVIKHLGLLGPLYGLFRRRSQQ
jgi:hypothetical protein